jgi:hypothetical protein
MVACQPVRLFRSPVLRVSDHHQCSLFSPRRSGVEGGSNPDAPPGGASERLSPTLGGASHVNF